MKIGNHKTVFNSTASQKTEEETIIDEGTNTTEGAKTFKGITL